MFPVVPLGTCTPNSPFFPSPLSLSYLTIVIVSRCANLIKFGKYPGIFFYWVIIISLNFICCCHNKKEIFTVFSLIKSFLAETKLFVLMFVIYPLRHKYYSSPLHYVQYKPAVQIFELYNIVDFSVTNIGNRHFPAFMGDMEHLVPQFS